MEAGAPVLRGPRVVLRKPAASDVEARLALGADAGIQHMFGASLDEIAPPSHAGVEAWLKRLAEHPNAWVIAAPALIGEVRLDRVDRRDGRASLAIGILDARRLGQGLGTEAMRLVLRHAFGALGLHRVSARVLAHNARAIRAYEKCGFAAEGREREAALIDGVWHDDLIMGVLDRDFARIDAASR
jgi:RimJ/RimL family protein N-acetyltransferase